MLRESLLPPLPPHDLPSHRWNHATVGQGAANRSIELIKTKYAQDTEVQDFVRQYAVNVSLQL